MAPTYLAMAVGKGADTRIDCIVGTLLALATVVMVLVTIINQLLVYFQIIIYCMIVEDSPTF